MESLIVILIAICGVVVLLVRRSAALRHPRETLGGRGQQVSELPSREAPPAPIGRKPFDAKSASPVDYSEHVITGPAYVVDGDTIVIRKTQIRLFGIDAPELNHPHGKRAKGALIGLCKGQSVRAEITDLDNHGRTVAKCILPDGRDLSAEMVKLGLAIDWRKFSGGLYRELETHDARKKLWLADARQKGRMQVWERFEARQKSSRKEG